MYQINQQCCCYVEFDDTLVFNRNSTRNGYIDKFDGELFEKRLLNRSKDVYKKIKRRSYAVKQGE